MARIKGAKNFHLAEITENTEENYTVGIPEKTERLTSISVDNKINSETVYSDDEVEEDIYGAIATTGKVGLNYLTNETKLKLFGGEIDADGVYYPPGQFEVKHHAMLFEAPTTQGSKYVCYYDVVFELPGFKAETAEDKPKVQEIELSFKAYKNKKLDTHYADLDTTSKTANTLVAKDWFKKVRTEKAAIKTTESENTSETETENINSENTTTVEN